MNVVAAFLGVGTAYIAFFNYVLLKRTQGTHDAGDLTRLRQKYRMTAFAFVAATILLVITVATSSVAFLELALIFVVVGALSDVLFRLLRRVP